MSSCDCEAIGRFGKTARHQGRKFLVEEDTRMAVGHAINTCSAVGRTTGATWERERILIIDANMADRERLAREFRAAGYDVTVVRTSDQALVLLRSWLSC